jgi:hypothetical protein
VGRAFSGPLPANSASDGSCGSSVWPAKWSKRPAPYRRKEALC